MLENISRKFTTVRDEARLTRMQLLDEAAGDLKDMREDL